MNGRGGDDPSWAAQRREAAQAEELMASDGVAASDLARALLAASPLDDGAGAIAHRVLALGSLRHDDVRAAANHVDVSVAMAERSGDDEVLGKALMTAMAVAASGGDFSGALALADRAERHASDELRVRIAIQRASVLVAGLSRIDEAIDEFDRVLRDVPHLRPFELGILRLNRGSQLLRRGDLVQAADDFAAAGNEFRALGNRHYETAADLHLALAAARMGDLPRVFAIYQRLSDDGRLSASDPADQVDLTRCLIMAGLLTEAAEVTTRAIGTAADSPPTPVSVQLELLAALIERLRGSRHAAEAAARARASAEDLGSGPLASIAVVEHAMSCETTDAVSDTELRRAAELLEREGHRREALDARIELTKRALHGGGSRPGRALAAFDPAMTPFDRAQVRHLRALQRCAAGDGPGARRELLAGIRAIERARASIAAADVKAAASDRAPEMAALGLRLAIAAGRPRAVLEWAERVRATALRLTNPRRESSPMLRDQLDELRRVEGADPSRAADVERRITLGDRTRRDDSSFERISNAREICAALGPQRLLLEYVELDGRLWRCTVERGRVTFCDLGVAAETVADDVGRLLFGLRRMASRTGPMADSAATMVAGLAARMAERILPVDLGDATEVVVVPTGSLHHLPWATLPGLRDRAFVVVPSAHVWRSVERRPGRGSGVAVATGPGLVAAEPEAHEVAACWNLGAPPLIGATSAELSADLTGRAIAHLCCHGRFRTDSPQFSALELADGPYTVFDLEAVADLPHLVVLSACSLGSVDVRLGDDILGFPAAMFARGVATLIAAVMPVPDAASRELMVDLHANLASGSGPARALRAARTEAYRRGAAHAAAAGAFLCFGKG